MKLNKSIVGQAVGAALLLAASGAAFAYVPANNDDADVVLYWGGATASTLSAQELAVNALCDTTANGANAPHLLYVNSGANDAPGNDWAVACETSAAPNATKTGLPNGLKILIVKRDRDGSGAGVGPLQSNNTISFLTLAANCAVTPVGSARPQFLDPNGNPITLRGCTGTYTTNRLVEAGTSDIEPSKFFGLNSPNLDGTPTPYNPAVAFQSVSATGALVFNTPVTKALRDALQTRQYPASNVCNPGNADYTTLTTDPNDRADATNAESEACMPSLTRSEINSILTGRVATWAQLLDPAVATGNVQICRRVPGSGTQATINAIISSYPCDVNRADNSIDTIPPRTPNGTTVIGNSGSGDVDNCLHNFNASANPYAIGVLSVERNVNNTRNWRYIKIDGVAPTLRNVHAGDYSVWVQQSCQRRLNTLNTNTAVAAADTSANKNTLTSVICNNLNLPSRLVTLNNTYTWGTSGWLATATSAATNQYANVLSLANPVNAYTREYGVGLTNACMTPVKATAGGNAGRGTIVAPNPNWTP